MQYTHIDQIIQRILFRTICLLSVAAATPWAYGEETMDSTSFYVGGYTRQLPAAEAEAAGISQWSVDRASGALTLTRGPWPSHNPSYVVLGKDRSHLYSVNEVGEYNGRKSGYLTHYRLQDITHALLETGTMTANGQGPAYLSIDREGRFLLLANYGEGNVSVYPINEGGSLGKATATVAHSGSGTNPQRQEKPHPHSIVVSLDNQFAYVPDLGIDQIKAYAFDEKLGTLTARDDLDVTVPPGSGPRHLTFDPSGTFGYCSLEMSSEVAAYRFAEGKLTPLGIYSTLPDDFTENSTTAEVRVSPSGNHVYVSNRGHDSIAGFAIDRDTGLLTRIQLTPTGGKTPRNFAIDPTGTVMVVANQQSNTLTSFRVDPATGLLTPTGQSGAVPAPSYICFYE